MTATAATSPQTMADDATIGTVAWTNPNNSKVSDNIYATVADQEGDVTTHYLKATNFGFSIPTGATIDGILVEIERKDSGAFDWIDNIVSIVKANGTISTTNKSTSTFWSTTESYISFGGATDKWGESWTEADIEDIDFGVVFSAYQFVYGTSISVDHIRITVYYTEGGTNYTQTVSDTLTLIGSDMKTVTKPTSDTLALADTSLKSYNKYGTETLGIVASYDDVWTANRFLTETLATVDSSLKSITDFRGETLTISDSSIIGIGWVKMVSDAFSVADSRLLSATRRLTETLSIIDSSLKGESHLLTETPTISDSSIKGTGKTSSETLTLTDTKLLSTTKSLSELMVITESTIKNISFIVSQSMTLADSIVKGCDHLLSDNFNLSESIRKDITALRTDTLSLTDSLYSAQSKLLTESMTLDVSEVTGKYLQVILTEMLNLSVSFKRIQSLASRLINDFMLLLNDDIQREFLGDL
jgi:hypothetical protein